MNTPTPDTSTLKPSTHHPLMIAAAIAIILFCLAGTAAILGWIPSSIGGSSSSGELTASDRAAMASRLADTDLPATATQRDHTAQQNRDRAAQQDRDREIAMRERETAPAPVAHRPAPPMQLAADTASAHPNSWCGHCGNVESVREITTRAQGSGVGAVGGAVLGGLLGNQVGGGNGRKLATVAGVVGGAVVGNQVEGNMKASHSYEVHVRLDDGSSRSFHLQNLDGFNRGDRIKVVDGSLRHAG